MLRIAAITVLMGAIVATSGCGSSPSQTSTQAPAQTPPPSGSPVNSITSISPTSAVAGSPDLTLTITGTELNPAPPHNGITKAVWSANGSNTVLATTVVSGTKLTAVIPAALLSSPIIAQLFVEGGDPNRDTDFMTNPITFRVLAPTGTTAVGFVKTGSMTTARDFHTATLLGDGRVLIAGGGAFITDPDCETAQVTAEIYDPNTRTFSSTSSLSESRYGHAATLLVNGKVLITGGGADCSPGLSSAELFDPITGSFTVGQPMHARRTFHTATLLSDGKVLVAGGWPQNGGPTAEVYDPLTGQFGATKPMTTARDEHAAVLLPNGQVLITGGYDSTSTLSSAELYDPLSDTFHAAGNMVVARILHTATVLANGKVLIAGGTIGDGNAIASAEIYDPLTGQFRPTGNMQFARLDHRATLLSDGRVLITGGSSGPNDRLETAELFDPATGQFTSLLIMSDRRDAHTSTLLNDGQVLVAGGGVASADLYK